MPSIQSGSCALVWGALALTLGACRSYESYHFGPSPQTHELIRQGKDTPIARAQISALGIFAGERGGAKGLEMRFRMRIENPGDEPLTVHRPAFSLVDGQLTSFGEPRIQAVPPVAIGPRGTAVVDVAFPFPPGSEPEDVDLTGLVFSWGVATPEREWVASARFAETWPGYPYSYGHPYYAYPYYGYRCRGTWGPHGYWGGYWAGYGLSYSYRY